MGEGVWIRTPLGPGAHLISVPKDEREVRQRPRELGGEQPWVENAQPAEELDLELKARDRVRAQSVGDEVSCLGGDAAQHDEVDRAAQVRRELVENVWVAGQSVELRPCWRWGGVLVAPVVAAGVHIRARVFIKLWHEVPDVKCALEVREAVLQAVGQRPSYDEADGEGAYGGELWQGGEGWGRVYAPHGRHFAWIHSEATELQLLEGRREMEEDVLERGGVPRGGLESKNT